MQTQVDFMFRHIHGDLVFLHPARWLCPHVPQDGSNFSKLFPPGGKMAAQF